MALTYVATSAAATGGSTMSQPLPAGWAADDLAVLVVASGQEDNALPSLAAIGGDWTYAGTTVGTDAAAVGVEAGPRRLTFYTRQLAAGDGAVTITQPATTLATMASRVILLRKAITESWRISTAAFGEDVTSGTAWSAPMTTLPSRLGAGAFVVAGRAGAVANTPVVQALSAETITAAGATIGAVTERADNGNSVNGAEAHLGVWTATVTAGTATANPVIAATLAAADTGVGGILVVNAVTGSITAAQATRGEAQRINGLTNPGAESGATTGWGLYQSAGTGTVDVVDVDEEGLGPSPSDLTSRRAFRVTGATTNTGTLGLFQTLVMQLPPGTTVTLSADVYLPAGHAVDSVRFGFYTAAGSLLSTSTVTTLTTGWRRYYATYTLAAAQTLGRIYVYTVDSALTRGADTIYLDNLILDTSAALRDYFDGGSNLPGYVHQWAGTPQFSESLQYLAADPPRVGVTLFNWARDDEVQVYRVHPDQTRHEVRGGLLTPSGGAAFVWDYEFPTNVEFYYVANDAGTERTTAVLDEVVVRRNSVLNPALTVDATGWSVNTASAGTGSGARVDGAVDGPLVSGVRRDYYRLTWATITTGAPAASGLYYGTGTSDMVDATPGPWTASVYWRSNVVDRSVLMIVSFYDAAGVQVGTDLSGAVWPATGYRWSRASVSGTAPAGASRALVRLYASAGANWAVNSTFEATALLVEDNVATVQPYFDGDSPGTGYRWQGAAGASFSEVVATDLLVPLAVNDTRSFLRAPGLPGLDVAVQLARVPDKTRPRPVNYLAPIGRATLVPQAGARQKPAMQLELVTLTEADAAALVEFMDGTPTALLLFPNTDLHGLYVSLGDLSEKVNPTVGPTEKQWTVAAVVVGRPSGGVAYDPNASWAGLVATSSTWQAVLNTYPSWLDVLRGPPVSE
jgi:hypothetical protein